MWRSGLRKSIIWGDCVPRSGFRVLRSAFRVPRSAFSILRSVFRVPRSAFEEFERFEKFEELGDWLSR